MRRQSSWRLPGRRIDTRRRRVDHRFSTQHMPLGAGVTLGSYEIEAQIGAGGMGEVYRARDTRLHRVVAVKVLPPGFSADPERVRRFEQESRAAAALNHPHLLAVYDVGHEGTPYIVSELLDGETLRDRLQNGALPVRKAIDYAIRSRAASQPQMRRASCIAI